MRIDIIEKVEGFLMVVGYSLSQPLQRNSQRIVIFVCLRFCSFSSVLFSIVCYHIICYRDRGGLLSRGKETGIEDSSWRQSLTGRWGKGGEGKGKERTRVNSLLSSHGTVIEECALFLPTTVSYRRP